MILAFALIANAAFVMIVAFLHTNYSGNEFSTLVSALIAGLLIKHFIADGALQTAYQYLNKGIFGHPGGIIHALIHGIMTFLVVLAWSLYFDISIWVVSIAAFAIFDFITHYLTDWLKVRTTKKYRWSEMVMNDDGTPKGLMIYSNNFFIALLADQLVHGLVYTIIVHWALLFAYS